MRTWNDENTTLLYEHIARKLFRVRGKMIRGLHLEFDDVLSEVVVEFMGRYSSVEFDEMRQDAKSFARVVSKLGRVACRRLSGRSEFITAEKWKARQEEAAEIRNAPQLPKQGGLSETEKSAMLNMLGFRQEYSDDRTDDAILHSQRAIVARRNARRDSNAPRNCGDVADCVFSASAIERISVTQPDKFGRVFATIHFKSGETRELIGHLRKVKAIQRIERIKCNPSEVRLPDRKDRKENCDKVYTDRVVAIDYVDEVQVLNPDVAGTKRILEWRLKETKLVPRVRNRKFRQREKSHIRRLKASHIANAAVAVFKLQRQTHLESDRVERTIRIPNAQIEHLFATLGDRVERQTHQHDLAKLESLFS